MQQQAAPPVVSYQDTRAEGTTEMGPTTTNIATSLSVVADQNAHTSVSDLYLSTKTYVPTIEEYFARPVVLQKGLLQSSDVPTTFNATYLPSGLLNLYAPYTQKLKGSFGFRGDIVLTVQVNGNRFQQGRYLLYAIPLGGASATATGTPLWTRMKEFTLTQRTQLPHVQFDVNCDTQAVLKLPFVSSEACWSIQNVTGAGVGDLYQVRLSAYVPVASVAGSAAADFTIWAHFENVQLTGATSFQSSFDDTYLERVIKARPQMAIYGEKEMESAGKGPISSVTAKVSKTANILAQIPLLSPFMSTASWMADIVGGAASVWGYSKPRNQEPGSLMIRRIAYGAGNVDGMFTGDTLGVSVKTTLSPLRGLYGTDEDQMSFNFIKKIPTYISLDSWNLTNNYGDNIKLVDMFPTNFSNAVTDTGVTVTNHTPISFLGSIFQLWRGSLVLRFTFVKTEFHTGRLLVIFVPEDTRIGSVSDPGMDNSNTAHRAVLDLRKGNTYDVTIPYISIQQYTDKGTRMGRVYVKVLDPLVAPATVPSSIVMITEVYGGEDLEFAIPCDYLANPYSPASPQSSSFTMDECREAAFVLGNADINPTIQHANASQGERLNSFRQLIKITQPIVQDVGSLTGTSISWYFYPWDSSACVLSSSLLVRITAFPTYIDWCNCMFAIMRGGIRLTVTTPENVQLMVSYLSALSTKGITSDASHTTSPQAWCKVNSIQNTGISGLMTVEIPYRNRYFASPTSETLTPSTILANNLHLPPTTAYFRNTGFATITPFFYKGGAEDLEFGLFSGIPPVQTSFTYFPLTV